MQMEKRYIDQGVRIAKISGHSDRNGILGRGRIFNL